jgi:hypothetical protein
MREVDNYLKNVSKCSGGACNLTSMCARFKAGHDISMNVKEERGCENYLRSFNHSREGLGEEFTETLSEFSKIFGGFKL